MCGIRRFALNLLTTKAYFVKFLIISTGTVSIIKILGNESIISESILWFSELFTEVLCVNKVFTAHGQYCFGPNLTEKAVLFLLDVEQTGSTVTLK